jgi:hypothetical protein
MIETYQSSPPLPHVDSPEMSRPSPRFRPCVHKFDDRQVKGVPARTSAVEYFTVRETPNVGWKGLVMRRPRSFRTTGAATDILPCAGTYSLTCVHHSHRRNGGPSRLPVYRLGSLRRPRPNESVISVFDAISPHPRFPNYARHYQFIVMNLPPALEMSPFPKMLLTDRSVV